MVNASPVYSLRQDHPSHRTASYASRLRSSSTKLKDDLGFSFTLGGKDESTSKGKEKGKGGDREKEVQRIGMRDGDYVCNRTAHRTIRRTAIKTNHGRSL